MRLLLCLLIASLTITGCASSTPPSTPPTKPVLDSALAAPCPELGKPNKPGYDDWEDYSIEVIGKYGDCAARHRKTVEAWPK